MCEWRANGFYRGTLSLEQPRALMSGWDPCPLYLLTNCHDAEHLVH